MENKVPNENIDIVDSECTVYIPLSVSILHGHLVHGFRPLSASIPVC